MEISYYLYNAPKGHLGMHADGDESLAIGKLNEVKERIMRLYPQVKGWNKYENSLVPPFV